MLEAYCKALTLQRECSRTWDRTMNMSDDILQTVEKPGGKNFSNHTKAIHVIIQGSQMSIFQFELVV